MKDVYVVVAYDIVEDRTRARLAKRLLDFLPRVQKSVFEGPVPVRRLPSLEHCCSDLIDPETDSVRIYKLCAGCVPRIATAGCCVSPPTDEEDTFVP